MFCTNCGQEMLDGAAVCVKCGFAKDKGKKFCAKCGAQVNEGAAICVSCGSAVNNATPRIGVPGLGSGSPKSRMIAGLLAILLGGLGIHNFYLGDITKGCIQLGVTILLSWTFIAPLVIWVWALYEGIMLLAGKVTTDAHGNPLVD